jgi:hypothetical protein
MPLRSTEESQERISVILDFISPGSGPEAVNMHWIRTARSPTVKPVFVGLLAGMFLRLAIFVNNMYYPDIGMPYTWGVPALGMVVVGVGAYLNRR